MNFEPAVGSNGRLYFNYNPGARVRMVDDRGEQYELEILNCQYVNDKEYYQVARNRQPMLGRMSVNRLTYLLNHNQIETLAVGTPCELPLTNSEVKMYVGYMKRQRKADIQKVERQLKTTGYDALQKELNSVAASQAIAEMKHDTKNAARLKQHMDETEKRMAEILKYNDININILSDKANKPCERCNGTGFYNGDEANGICSCMRHKEQEIKYMCSRWRQ